MKPGWTYKKLGEVCSKITDGSHNPPKGVERSNNYMLSSQNVQNGYLDCSSVRYLSDKDFEIENQRTKASKGDVLLTIVGTIGRTCVLKGDEGNITFQRSVAILKPKDDILSYYLMYFLISLNSFLNNKAQGAAQKGIYLKQLGEIPISYPPLSEQQHIVERLDAAFAQIDELKANAEKQVNEARALFQRALTEAMEPKEGWEEKTLKDVSTIVGDYGLSVSSKPFDGVRYLRITDITDWGDLNDDIVSANVDSDKKQQELEEGDILFARTGATVGKTLVYKKEFGECLFAGYLIRYRLDKNKISPRFMYYVTHSKKYYDWVFVNQEAAAQPNISAKKYNLLPVNYPPLSEQQHIVARLDVLSARVRELEEIQKNVITECDNMKQAILRQVFE